MLIGEVAQRSGVSTRMLRHYDSLGLVRPTARSSAGYREYSEADIERLFHVESLRSLGLSLADVGRALDEPGFEPRTLMARLITDTRARIAGDAELLTRLERIEAAGPTEWSSVLEVVAMLRAVESGYAALRQRAALSAREVGVSSESLVEVLLAEPDTNVAGALRWALARRGGGRDRLVAAVADPDPTVRRRAVTALAELAAGMQVSGNAEAVGEAGFDEVLSGALTDTDATVRRIAALALGRRGEPGAVPALVELIAAGDGDVEAAEILSGFADDAERLVGLLVDRLADDPDPAVRSRLVQALAEIDSRASSAALASLEHDADETVARTATVIRAMHSR